MTCAKTGLPYGVFQQRSPPYHVHHYCLVVTSLLASTFRNDQSQTIVKLQFTVTTMQPQVKEQP